MKTIPITAWIYILAVAASLGYLFAMSRETAFCGLPAITLTMPWSMLLTLAGAFLAPNIFDSSLIPGVAIILISAGINSWIILKIAGRKNTK